MTGRAYTTGPHPKVNSAQAEGEAPPERFPLWTLEGRIDEVLCWANVLKHLGACPNRLEGGEISVIGSALDTLAGQMLDDWNAALAEREAGR